ncbi:hypothetical protein CVT24_010856 [Panaeolus cyanescens]|uniref:Uncharacterized protein n=1 Tax=Panaeolus cyanescens TaxID=181874 RepID=A0A409YYJ9_9AGAR|nr:hypothetical protein CVT24_010856 [Panaeolus cyanescens]
MSKRRADSEPLQPSNNTKRLCENTDPELINDDLDIARRIAELEEEVSNSAGSVPASPKFPPTTCTNCAFLQQEILRLHKQVIELHEEAADRQLAHVELFHTLYEASKDIQHYQNTLKSVGQQLIQESERSNSYDN